MSAFSPPAAATVLSSAHDHYGHDHHGHDHHQTGGPGPLHGHDHHNHASGRVHAMPETPHFSLMRLSAGQRLGAAAGLIALLWALVLWAMQ